MRFIIILLCSVVFLSCNKKVDSRSRTFTKIKIETILTDSLLSIRAIDLLEDNSLVFAANSNTYGLYYPETTQWKTSRHYFDSLNIQFRAVAHTAKDFFMMSIGNPALLFKTDHSGMQLVYTEEHERVFYDSMDFWNEDEGIAIGDPTDNCMSIIITRDGGNTWNKIKCENLPKAKDGEAAFAASNTNVAIIGDHTWIASGGMVSRIYYSRNKGMTWTVYDTPILSGKETTGIDSIDFYDHMNGFAIGGDYTDPKDNSKNKIVTKDGGRTWEVVGAGKEPGYRSCVQYLPNGAGKELVAVGFNGIDYSNDGGNNWRHLSDEGYYTIRFLNDSIAYAAGNGRISKLTFDE
jgi:photosystem II stability/assembly factor-like uncharacterized protein